MPMPDPIPEKYVSCVGSTFSIGGTYTAPSGETPASVSGGVELTITKGGIKRSAEVYEMTSNKDRGYYTDVRTTKKATGNLTMNYVGDEPPDFEEGEIYPVIMFNPETTLYFEGDCRFNNIDTPVLDVTTGLQYTFDITSQGPYDFHN